MEGGHKPKATGFKLFPSSKQRSSTNSNRENGSNNSASSAAAQSEPRRQLKTLELTPPDFKVDRQILIDSYLDIEVKFLGQLEDIPFEIDPTKRTEILRNIDTARKNKILPWNSHSSRYDAIIRLSARQINVLRKDETSLVRAFIHNIVSVSYVRDDAQHLVIMKTATESQQEKCELVVWECPSKEKSEEICAIVQQIFEVVYTEMTMKQFDLSLMQAVKDYSIGRSTVSHQRPPLPGLYSQPDTSSEAVPYSGANPNSNSAEIISVTAKVLLQEYIEELRSKLSGEELQQFASILKDYRQMGSIENFCTSLQRLYGPDRKTLFPDMRPYIPEKDMDYFESFLERNSLQDQYSFYHGGRRSRRTGSDASSTSTIGGVDNGVYSHSIPSDMDDLDRALMDVCDQVDRLDASIDS
ncbi:cerebral cavernous malformations protein 2 homolog isoform X1 [Lytechinus variegatus]|uniref:cerebral cavernous malformations protein 2 homolog isoform X1 n=1 Tax=Lytechinus variegatus TaxID=7654 RepID=UPI001BB1446E|nr:cerebral cavernous malformations protein 2 homolog isoform X1 [Lytechinus variegatus]